MNRETPLLQAVHSVLHLEDFDAKSPRVLYGSAR
jgi:hypothetical protein